MKTLTPLLLIFIIISRLNGDNLIRNNSLSLLTDSERLNYYFEKFEALKFKDLDSANYYAQLLESESKEQNNEVGIANAHYANGCIAEEKKEFLNALEQHHRAFNLRSNQPNKEHIAKSIFKIARCHFHLYNYEGAISYYKKSLIASTQIKHNFLNKLSLQNLSLAFQNSDQLDSAKYYYQQYIDLFFQKERPKRQFKAYNDYAIIFDLKGKYNEAEKYYRRAETMTIELDPYYLAMVSNNLGYLYRLMNQEDKSFEYTRRAIKIYRENEHEDMLGAPYLNLGQLYERQGKLDQAIEHLQLAAKYSNLSNGNYEDLKDIYHAQAQVYDRLGRQDQALTARRNEENIKAMLAEQNSNQEQQRKAAEELERRLAEEGQTATTPIWFMALLGGGALIALLGIGYMARKLQPAYVTADSGQQTTTEDAAWTKKEYKVAFAQLTREKNQLNFQLQTVVSEKAEVLQENEQVKLELEIKDQQKEALGQQLSEVKVAKSRIEREKEAIQRDHAQMKAEFNKMKEKLEAGGSSEAAAQQMIDAIEEKMAKIIHDLKSPISSAQRLSEMVRAKITEALAADKNLQTRMHMLDVSLDRAINLVETNLRALANSHAQKQVDTEFTVTTEFDLTGLITEIAAQNEGLLQQKKLTLNLEKNLVEMLITSVRQHIDRIVQNLLSNAIKFSPEGKNIYLGLQKVDEQNVRIWIKDEGPGMSEQDRKKLYNSFQTLTAKSTAGESSTGLGTSIVAELVQELGGKIECESELGVGTTFYVTLPVG